jgi:signal transduction histidine kinase
MVLNSKPSLLVVDDEPDLVQSVKDLLRYEYRVFGVTRAAEGLQIMEREPIDIVMSDQRMPEMTGVEFLKRLREKYPDTIRLLFTAYADINAVTDAINEGNVYRYITKPWEPDELRAVLRQAADYRHLIVERKRLTSELQEKNKQLESANQELRRANEMKKIFIKVASHELCTPLTIMLGFADLALRTADSGTALHDWLKRIYTGSQRLNDRVQQMVRLMQADRFERTLNARPVDLGELLKRAASSVAIFIEQRKQRLDVQTPPAPVTLIVEEDKLHDSVVQLLINAIKFTPDGGMISLTAGEQADGTIEIAVADNGVGIEAHNLECVFDPFFTRFDVNRHSSGVFEFDRRGLGLGLSVVKAFSEMHGGRVKVESQVGTGSKFSILLPPDRKAVMNGEKS